MNSSPRINGVVALCTLVGGLLGPVAAPFYQDPELGSRWARQRQFEVHVTTFMLVGLAVGATVGLAIDLKLNGRASIDQWQLTRWHIPLAILAALIAANGLWSLWQIAGPSASTLF